MASVAVIGAGIMGRGIAQVAAFAGFDVAVYDVDRASLTAALAAILRDLERGVERGKVSPQERDAVLARIERVEDLARAVGRAALVIEAVPEDLELKRRLFEQLDRLAPPQALLASNTSSLSVTRLGEVTGRPDKVLGMHFFNPPPRMVLLEIVRGAHTSEVTVAQALDYARRFGKEPIVVRDRPGFATSRLGVLLGLEAMRMLEEGVASAEDIDKAMELGYRHPMGPLRLSDLVGLDVRLAIAEHLWRELGAEAFRPPEILRRLVAEGKLGRKTGQGFYRWPTDDAGS